MPQGRFRLFTTDLVTSALLAVGAVAMLAFSSGARAVPFTIASAQFLPGIGYGIDIDETNGTLLDVRFLTGAFTTQSFALSAVNQSFTFNFGTIDLEEPNAHSGINAFETDNLGIIARLTFTAPTGVLQTIIATGSATPGSVSDSGVDYVIDWSPVTIPFGNGGEFKVYFTDMSFNDMGSQFQTATVTLASLSEGSSRDITIPEPASIALLGIGIGCLAITRRRRAKEKAGDGLRRHAYPASHRRHSC